MPSSLLLSCLDGAAAAEAVGGCLNCQNMVGRAYSASELPFWVPVSFLGFWVCALLFALSPGFSSNKLELPLNKVRCKRPVETPPRQ